MQKDKPTIGIIGAGNIGGTLARRFRATKYDVSVANAHDREALNALAEETGAHAVSVAEAARADAVVVAIPMNRIAELPRELFADDRGTVVIDTSNYYPRHRDGRIDGLEAASTESGWVASTIGHPVVKCFNMIVAESLGTRGVAAGAPGRIALAIAGDDARAKAIVGSLVDAIGFDVVDAGTIAESWRLQPGTPVYCRDMDAAHVRRALDEARPERTADWRATDESPGTYEDPR